jgi:glycerol-3-phosphate dehydrogenase
VLAICADDPDLCRPIVSGMPDLLVEAVVAARHEQARTVADVLLRRTRLGLLAGRRTVEDRDVALRVARAMARERGWGRRDVKRAAEAWPAAVSAERLVVGEEEAAVRS